MRPSLRHASVFLIGSLLAAACSGDSGVQRSSATRDLDPASGGEFGTEPLPADEAVVFGTLDNGLTYYVRENTTPGQNAELRLAVDAGSLSETPEQAGVAHFLEHMLFNGTEEYPGNELVAVLESFGMAFGADLNAYTSFDETVYELSVPLADEENFDTALGVLSQWLGHATLDEADVVAERGVVLDEWRGGQTADGRYFEALEQFFLDGTAAQDKDPIGNETAIQAMTPELVRAFYDTWYRPDNAAVIVVGDIDADDVVRRIEEQFGDLEPRGDRPEPVEVILDPFNSPKTLAFQDPDLSWATVEYSLPAPSVPQQSPAAVAEATYVALAFDMIATRLSDDATTGQPSFTNAYVSDNSFLRSLDAPSVAMDSRDEGVAESLDALVEEFERARRFGFGDNELERAVAAIQTGVDARYDGRSSIQDARYADAYVEAFVGSSPYPNADTEHELMTEILDAASAEVVMAAFERRLEVAAPHVLARGSSEVAVPTAEAIQALLDEVGRRDLEPRADAELAGDELMAVEPGPVEESSAEEPYARPEEYKTPTVLTFPNGARVVLNRTSIVEGSIALTATSKGGMSLVADDDVTAAVAAMDVVTSSGLGDLDQVQLEQVLANAAAGIQPVIRSTSEHLYGSANSGDLEVLFQLIHLLMTAPRATPAALNAYIEEASQGLAGLDGDASSAAYAAQTEARYGDAAERFGYIPTIESLEALTPERVLDVFRQRFGDAGDWVFSFSGDLEVDEATDFARSYIGSLPETGVTEDWVDLQPDPPAGVVAVEVPAGTGDAAVLSVLHTAPAPAAETDEIVAQLLTSILDMRLVEHLREELGETYSPSSYVAVSSEPDSIVETSIDVSGSPDAMPRLAAALQEDLVALRDGGPTVEEFDAAVEEFANGIDYFSNEYLNYEFIDVLLYGAASEDYSSSAVRSLLGDVTIDTVTEFARAVLPSDQYIQVIARPS